MSPQVQDKIDEIIDRYNKDESMLIGILQDIQQEYQYLPKEILLHLRDRLRVPLPRIYAVATFYKAFSLRPRGKHFIQVCLGTACHVRGAPKILEEIERKLGIKSGETTEDLNFTLETVNCLGACALGPLMVIDGKYFGNMTPSKADKILKGYKNR
jgi:NADH-quinone oxidoreductase subunit E